MKMIMKSNTFLHLRNGVVEHLFTPEGVIEFSVPFVSVSPACEPCVSMSVQFCKVLLPACVMDAPLCGTG